MITLQSNVDYLSDRITSRDNNFKNENENNYNNEDYTQNEGTWLIDAYKSYVSKLVVHSYKFFSLFSLYPSSGSNE